MTIVRVDPDAVRDQQMAVERQGCCPTLSLARPSLRSRQLAAGEKMLLVKMNK